MYPRTIGSMHACLCVRACLCVCVWGRMTGRKSATRRWMNGTIFIFKNRLKIKKQYQFVALSVDLWRCATHCSTYGRHCSPMFLWMKTPACKNEFTSECKLQARLTIYKCKNATYYLFCWPLAFYPDKSLVRTVPLVSLVDRTIFLCLMQLHDLLLHGQQLADSFLFS